jgi:hypothetical protein
VVEARALVERSYQALLAAVDPPKRVRLAAIEGRLWLLLLALGRALVLLFFAHRVATTTERYTLRLGRAPEPKTRDTELGTRFGRVTFSRPFWRMTKRGAAVLPLDQELGLCGGFSLGVVMGIARFCAQMSFGSVRREWREIYEWAPSSRSVLRMVDAVGEQARPFLEALPAPDDDGEILVAEVDAGGAPMISVREHALRRTPRAPQNRREKRASTRAERRLKARNRQKPRRTKGKKSKNSKMAVVAAVYTLKRLPDGTLDGPRNKRLIATFAPHDELFKWLVRELEKRGYPRKRTLFLADGSKAIWAAQARHLPKVEVCIDWYHVVEKLWTAGECFFPEGSDALKAWVARQKRNLRHGRKKQVLEELGARMDRIPRTGPGNKGKRKRLAGVIAYLKRHKKRLRYRACRAEALPIATGVIEGAVRNLIRMRLDGPGMRWGRERSERVLHLRCILLSDQWDAFRDTLSASITPILAARPEPATPHDATRKEAA